MELSATITKIQSDLGIEIVSTEIEGVYDELLKFISKVHPDKFTDDSLKQENVLKTQTATLFLAELKKELERRRIAQTSIVPYDETKVSLENFEYRLIVKENEIFQARSELALKEKTISEKSTEIKNLTSKIKELEEVAATQRSSRVSDEKNQVIESVKPKQPALITAGAITTLIVVYNVLGQVEVLSKKLSAYLPVPEIATNIGLFTILLVTLLVIAYRFLRAAAVRKFLNVAITQPNITAIGKLVSDGQLNRQQIHDFYSERLQSSRGIHRLLNRFWRIDEPIIVEQAISVVVDYMISNAFIEKSYIRNMVQYYKVTEVTFWDLHRKSREE